MTLRQEPSTRYVCWLLLEAGFGVATAGRLMARRYFPSIQIAVISQSQPIAQVDICHWQRKIVFEDNTVPLPMRKLRCNGRWPVNEI